MKNVLLTGGTGLVGVRLTELLLENGYTVSVLSRKSSGKNPKVKYYQWRPSENYIDLKALEHVDHIIHLAGAGIADKKWTKSRKELIISSRVNTAQLIRDSLVKHQIKIQSFISSSAIGFYGAQTTDKIFTETAPKGGDFLSEVCSKWEHEATAFQTEQVASRSVILRLGIVLSAKGGALEKMSSPINYYVGAALGAGDQYMPWIHIDDLCRMYLYALDHPTMGGVFNAVAPSHITNRVFTKVLAKQLKKPLFLPNVPSFIIRLIFGESAVILLEGSRVSSEKVVGKGFQFENEDLEGAMVSLYLNR